MTDPSKAQRFSVIWQQTTGHGNIGNNRGQSDTGILENVYKHHIVEDLFDYFEETLYKVQWCDDDDNDNEF